MTVDFTAPPGGVMTDEVGVITGDLTLREEVDQDHLYLRVQYKEADEWYTVTDGTAKLSDSAAVEAVRALAAKLTAPA